MEVEIVELEEQQIAYIEHHGDPLKLVDTLVKFVNWRIETGFSPVDECNTYGVLHTNPEETGGEDFRFDVCGTVNKPIPENYFDVKNGTIPAGRFAVTRHTGSYENVAKTLKELMTDWLPRSGESKSDEPCYFHYVNSTYDVDHEDDLITDIYMPLKELKLDEGMN